MCGQGRLRGGCVGLGQPQLSSVGRMCEHSPAEAGRRAACGQWDELSVARVLTSAAGSLHSVQLTWLTWGETTQLLETINQRRQTWQGLQRDASCCYPQAGGCGSLGHLFAYFSLQ